MCNGCGSGSHSCLDCFFLLRISVLSAFIVADTTCRPFSCLFFQTFTVYLRLFSFRSPFLEGRESLPLAFTSANLVRSAFLCGMVNLFASRSLWQHAVSDLPVPCHREERWVIEHRCRRSRVCPCCCMCRILTLTRSASLCCRPRSIRVGGR